MLLCSDLVLALPRLSTCELEVDCVAQDILNRHNGSLGRYIYVAHILTACMSDRAKTSVLQWEEWQWEELNHALKERFEAVSSEHGEGAAGLVDHTFSQSCQVELHEPTSLTEDVTPVGEELAGDQSICDEEVIRRSVELCQRLSPRAIRQSTDEDLLSLLEDLAAGSASPRPSQAAPPSLYESSAQRLATQLRRSVSSASASQPNDAGSGTVRRAESVGLGPRSRPGSSLGSDEELFQSSPRGESPPPSFEAEPELDTPNVTTTTPISHLEPHGVDWSGAEVTYSMSETSFMQFEGTQLQPEGDMGPSRGPSGAISVATPDPTAVQEEQCVWSGGSRDDLSFPEEVLVETMLGGGGGGRRGTGGPGCDGRKESGSATEPSRGAPKSKGPEGPSLWQPRGEGVQRTPQLVKKSPDLIVQLDGAGDLPSDKDNSQDKGKKLSLRAKKHTDRPHLSSRSCPGEAQERPLVPLPTPAPGGSGASPLVPLPTSAPGSSGPVSSVPAPRKRKLSPIAEGSHSHPVKLPSLSGRGQVAALPAPSPFQGPTLEEVEGVEEVEMLEDDLPWGAGPSGESFLQPARPLDIKREGSSPSLGTTLLVPPFEGALNMKVDAEGPTHPGTTGEGDSNPIIVRTLGFDGEENISHGPLGGGSEIECDNALTCGGVSVGSANDDLRYAVSVAPKVAADDLEDLEEGETTAANHQLDEPDLISSDNDFHLTYASTSEVDSESCDQEEEEGGRSPPSPCEGPMIVRHTHVTLMSHPVEGVTLMSHPVGDVGTPSSALSHQGRKSGDLGTAEPVRDTREIPSPEVKSKYGLGGLDHGGCGLASPLDRVGAYKYACPPPSVEELVGVAKELGLPRAIHVKPFCGKPDDVQPAREVGGRLLKVRSHMPYDLRDFEPAYLSSSGMRFSSTGLSHWRLILAMVSSATGDVCLPPPCRKVEREGGGGLGTFYSADDHRRDVELRSHFFGDEIVAVTPTRLPPSGKDVMEWCKQRLREEEEGEEEVAGVTEGGAAFGSRGGGATGDQLASDACRPFSPHVDELCSDWEPLEGGGESEQTVMASGMDQSVEEEVAAKNGGEELGAMGVDSGAQKPAARLKEERRKLLFTTGVKRDASLLEGPSPENSFGFKMSESVLGTSGHLRGTIPHINEH
eukprot:Em0005g1458a